MQITMTIKKVYFDQILNGQKRFEYRQASEYYNNIVAKKPTSLKLHYQSRVYLLAKIIKIDLIEKPKELQDSPFLPTKKIYRFELGEIKYVDQFNYQ